MITLDGLRYTFNGQGEFVLLEATDPAPFLLQGRMQPLPSAPQGTVLTAMAARLGGVAADRVMVGTSWRGIEVYVNEHQLDVLSVPEQTFDSFSVSVISDIASIRFVNGIHVECRVNVARQVITAMIVSAPRSLSGQTRGLLGNFNGIRDDDLTPRGKDLPPIPADSDLQTIHEQFGVTCECLATTGDYQRVQCGVITLSMHWTRFLELYVNYERHRKLG